MGFLNFGKKSNAPKHDPDLDDLTIEEAQLLRQLFAEKWPATEPALTMHGEFAESADGNQYGLYNLSRTVKSEPQSHWPELVERHITHLLTSQSAPEDDALSEEEIFALAKARLTPAEYLPEAHRPFFTYRRSIVGDLEAILMLDYPETTNAIPDSIVEQLDAEALWKKAIAAVADEPIDEIASVDAGNGPFYGLAEESMFTASRALDFPALLERAGVTSAPHGVLFVVPSRHHLAFHVVEGTEALDLVRDLGGFAQMTFDKGVGEISPHVFYWNEAGYEQVTIRDESGSTVINGTGSFFEAVNSF